MEIHKILLSDGTAISSGRPGTAIGSVSLYRTVNNGRELNFGAVCAAVCRIELVDAGERCPLSSGEEFTLLRGEERLGVFTVEDPVRIAPGCFRLTACDRIVRLEENLDAWLDGLAGWPYTAAGFAGLVAERCGIPLSAAELPFGAYPVQAFSGTNITGRRLIGWIAQLTGTFARANPAGELEFAWYAPANGELAACAADSLQYEGYTVTPADRVCIRRGDKAVFYPESGEYTLTISENPLLSGTEGEVARALYEKLQAVSYTPCTVTVQPGTFAPGQQLFVTDSRGNRFSTLIMTARQAGGRETLESTGSRRSGKNSLPAAGTGTPVFYGGEWKQITPPRFSMKELTQ